MSVLKQVASRRVVAALIAAAVVSGGVFLVLMSRPGEYSARVGLFAVPGQAAVAPQLPPAPPEGEGVVGPDGVVSPESAVSSEGLVGPDGVVLPESVVSSEGVAAPEVAVPPAPIVVPEASSADFAAVAAQSMAAIAEAAHSPSVLQKAGTDVPGAPSGSDLFDSVTVDLVPNSNLARITVTSPSRDVASGVALSLAREVVAKDLLRPVGTLRIIDEQPLVTKVSADSALAGGLTLAAGAVTGVAIFGLLTLVAPTTRQQISRTLQAAGAHRPVPILSGGRHGDLVANIDMLATAAARPVRVIGLTPQSGADARRLAHELDAAGVRLSADGPDDDTAVVGVASRQETVSEIRWAVSAVEPDRFLAIVLR